MRHHCVQTHIARDLIVAQPGKTLLSKQAFDELLDLQSWIKTVEYKHPDMNIPPVKLENMCYKVVDGATNYFPCFQISPLDCFKEGAISVIGESASIPRKSKRATDMRLI